MQLHVTINKFYVFIVTCLLVGFTYAQEITGYVYDAHTKEPIPGVTVYFDGTSTGVVTGLDGYFELTTSVRINSPLLVSYMGYTSVQVADPYNAGVIKVYLEESSFKLDEIVLQADPFTREEKMKVFREQFLGKDFKGKCSILNEDAIVVTYSMGTQTLFAYADEPLQIKNDYLGYDITYNLLAFEAHYHKTSLDPNWMRNVFFAGTSFFRDVSEDKGKYERRRRKIYYGSPVHFLKTLANEQLTEEKFGIYKGSFPVDPKLHFKVADTLPGLKKVSVEHLKWNVLYKKDKQSSFSLNQKAIYIDTYGNFSPVTAINFGGYMGTLRFKDTLPLDYLPED